MKKIYRILLTFTFLIICVLGNGSLDALAQSSLTSEIVIETSSGRILHEVNANKKMPIASTTKIVTAITVIDNYDINQEVVVPQECVGVEGSSIYLSAGDKFSVIDLLYGLMLRSGNDSAKTLAITLAGSVEKFTEKMNETAKKCGAKNSNFINPHGLHDDNHYSTAYDLAVITGYALKNKVFADIVKSKKYLATEINTNSQRIWFNKNKILNSFDGATGVKTGYTKKAGRCLVSSAKRDGMEIVSVVLNCPMMFERSKEILGQAYDQYRLVKVIDCEKFDYRLPSENGNYVKLKINQSFYYPLKNNEEVSAYVKLPKILHKNVKKDQKVGEIEIYNSKQLIFSQNIYTL